MPASFTIDFARGIVLSRGWGVLENDDLRRTQRGLHESEGFEPTFGQLFDFSEVTELRVTAAGVRELVPDSPFAQDARRAIVVASEAAFGMSRMYQQMSERDMTRFRIFRDRDAAVRWLEGSDAG